MQSPGVSDRSNSSPPHLQQADISAPSRAEAAVVSPVLTAPQLLRAEFNRLRGMCSISYNQTRRTEGATAVAIRDKESFSEDELRRMASKSLFGAQPISIISRALVLTAAVFRKQKHPG